MASQKFTFKWQDKSERFNGKTKVNVKWQNKIVRLNGKTIVYV